MNAKELFDAYITLSSLEGDLFDFLQEEVLQVSLEDCPFQDTGHDYYDESVELFGCKEGFTLTEEQLQKIFAVGFKMVFINRVDKTAVAYTPTRPSGGPCYCCG